MTTFTESDVESATLSWLADSGWCTAHGPDIAPGTPGAERAGYGGVILARRLRDALARLNPDLPSDTLDDAFRKLTHPPETTLETRNRAFHRLTVDGVTVDTGMPAPRSVAARPASSTSTTPPATTGWRSTSSPSWRTGASAAPTWCCSSTACRWRSSN